MVLSGSKKVSARASMSNQGTHFGSMPGTAPSVGQDAATKVAYKNSGLVCNVKSFTLGCTLNRIPAGTPQQQYQYLSDNGLIFRCKQTGGVGRKFAVETKCRTTHA